MSRYVAEFLSLKSVPDILGTIGFLGNKPEKEITEAMAIIHKLKRLTLSNPNKYTLIDLCSGNALVPVIAAHLLPVQYAVAIDKKPRERNWERAKKFVYVENDIYDLPSIYFEQPTILTAVHCCRDLAEQVIKIYNENEDIEHLIFMPCCHGELNSSLLRFIKEEANGDLAWVTKLALMCKGKVKISKDNFVLSPKRYIIRAQKERQE